MVNKSKQITPEKKKYILTTKREDSLRSLRYLKKEKNLKTMRVITEINSVVHINK